MSEKTTKTKPKTYTESLMSIRGKVKVDTKIMKNIADNEAKTINLYKENFEDINKQFNNYESMWSGVAAEIYKGVFNRDINNLSEAIIELEKSPKELLGFYTIYTKTIGKTEVLASEVKPIKLK